MALSYICRVLGSTDVCWYTASSNHSCASTSL